MGIFQDHHAAESRGDWVNGRANSPRSRRPGLRVAVYAAMLALVACNGPASSTIDGSAGDSADPEHLSSLEPDAKSSKTDSLPTPARLKGLSEGQLKAALGEPTLLRQDGNAQLWQYAGSGCVLHVFLYDDHGTYRVTYSQVRVDDPEVANPPTCVEWKSTPRSATTAGRTTLPAPAGQPPS